VANTDKDWGVSIFLPVDPTHTVGAASPPKKENQNAISIGKNQFINFCTFMREVLRIEIHNYDFDDSEEMVHDGAKRAKTDVQNGGVEGTNIYNFWS